MKRKRFLPFSLPVVLFSLLLTAILLLGANPAPCAENRIFKTDPVNRNKTEKWRIGYLEGGGYHMYPAVLRGIVGRLAETGWVEKVELPPGESITDTAALWQWLAKNVKSRYIEFVPDAYWTAGWDTDRRKENRALVLKRLNEKKDIDLMIASGTWAGQDLAGNDHSVPTIVCSTSDAVASKIIKSPEDSGFDHIHARVDPTRFQRQIRLFHDIFNFKTLGIAYIDSVSGRSYAAVEDVEKMAAELSFKIERCLLPENVEGKELTNLTVTCHEKLAETSDAVYITIQTGVTLRALPRLMAPLNGKQIPTFSQAGAHEVRHGVLMSISQANYKYVSEFYVDVIAAIFNGARPRDLEQVFEAPPQIALNIAEAVEIGFDPPVDILSAADEIYNEIEVTDKKKWK